MRLFISTLLLCLAFGLSLPANLIQNGSFELQNVSTPGTVNNIDLLNLQLGQWEVYGTLPGGWSAVTGYECNAAAAACNSAGIELQRNGAVGGVTANTGTNYVELDSHPGPQSNAAMTQSLNLAGGVYELSYWYLPRTTSPGDNGVNVWVDNVLVDTADDVSPNVWAKQLVSLSLTPGTYSFTFGATGLENTLGAFIDDVSLDLVRDPNEVPEPATMSVLGLGLVALAFARRFRS